MEQRSRLLAGYARAIGLRLAIPSNTTISGSLAKDFNNILDSLKGIVDQSLIEQLYFGPQLVWGGESRSRDLEDKYCNSVVLLSKVSQLISYLEHIHHTNSTILEIGSLFNSIKDRDLKERCSDLLSAPGNFDRAINQATQVLEDKIRKKAKIDSNITGPNLVNAAINSNLQKGMIRISPNQEEHEGIGHICRGIMLAFRNPTHHHLSDQLDREDALKLCAFIDSLLASVENSEEIKK